MDPNTRYRLLAAKNLLQEKAINNPEFEENDKEVARIICDAVDFAIVSNNPMYFRMRWMSCGVTLMSMAEMFNKLGLEGVAIYTNIACI